MGLVFNFNCLDSTKIYHMKIFNYFKKENKKEENNQSPAIFSTNCWIKCDGFSSSWTEGSELCRIVRSDFSKFETLLININLKGLIIAKHTSFDQNPSIGISFFRVDQDESFVHRIFSPQPNFIFDLGWQENISFFKGEQEIIIRIGVTKGTLCVTEFKINSKTFKIPSSSHAEILI